MDELTKTIAKYGISRAQIAREVGCSRPLVSLVLSGQAADRRGIIETALDLIEKAQDKEERTQLRLAELCGSAA